MKAVGRISGLPGLSGDCLPLHPCTDFWGKGCFQGPSRPQQDLYPLPSALTGALCPGCVPHSLLVTGLLSKMGLRLVRACAHVLCINNSDKASVCGSLVGWGLGPPQSPVYQALDAQRVGWCVQEVGSAERREVWHHGWQYRPSWLQQEGWPPSSSGQPGKPSLHHQGSQACCVYTTRSLTEAVRLTLAQLASNFLGYLWCGLRASASRRQD